MRIGLVVDAGCDLPEAILADESVVVLPIAVRIGDYLTEDSRNDEVTRQFLDSDIAKDAAEAETIPYTVEQIRELFLGRLVHEFDYVFCQTIPPAAARSTSARYRRASASSTTTTPSAKPAATRRRSPCACRTPATCSPPKPYRRGTRCGNGGWARAR